jgi:hypothetical protein
MSLCKKEKEKKNKKEKNKGGGDLKPILLVGKNVTMQAPSCNINNNTSSSNTSNNNINSNNSRIQRHKKSVVFNMK